MKYPMDKAADIAAKLYLMQPYYCRNITPEQILVRCESEEELNFYYNKLFGGENNAKVC